MHTQTYNDSNTRKRKQMGACLNSIRINVRLDERKYTHKIIQTLKNEQIERI